MFPNFTHFLGLRSVPNSVIAVFSNCKFLVKDQ